MSAFDPSHRNESLPARVTIALYRISQTIHHIFREHGENLGLSPAQIQALLFLRYARPGVRTIGGLATRLGTSYATSSQVADALERKRLVLRQALPEDRRTVTLHLTQEGEQKAEALNHILQEIETAITSLPESDQQSLQRAAQAIVRRLQQRGYVQVYEMCWNCTFFRRNAHPEDPQRPHHCAFVDAPLPEAETRLECPDFVPTD